MYNEIHHTAIINAGRGNPPAIIKDFPGERLELTCSLMAGGTDFLPPPDDDGCVHTANNDDVFDCKVEHDGYCMTCT